MSRLNKNNIDRRTNKPDLIRTEGLTNDQILNRAEQTRRDDDIIKTPGRKVYDVDYAIKWYIDNEIRPQITENSVLLSVPSIFASNEKWDSVQRLGYMRDEKGMAQAPSIMIKRNSVVERDNLRTLDVNRMPKSNFITHKQRYNPRNRYEDELFPFPINTTNAEPALSDIIYMIDIPKYVTVEYELLIWCNLTVQLNDLVEQILPYGRYAWGNPGNHFETAIGSITYDNVNTVGEDRVVKATIPLTVQATLLPEHESRISTLKKMYSIKKVSFDVSVDIGVNLFETTNIPAVIIQSSQQILGGVPLQITSPAGSASITTLTYAYIIGLSDRYGTYSNSTTITVTAAAAINPTNNQPATKNEFDLYINGQYIDKAAYTWTPSEISPQTIVFDTNALGYTIESEDLIVINGRWA